ncbi:anaerobic ribonucleoside-triphosphate reductase activating protein [Holdemanella biformis]|uniref:anaerobic ribonucleoside-triphosphate reductase activating protein n=1 Tax=Holdemanella biformis TaxID=1735 RepID=UPI00248F93F1|nr:anaerobic ribonucleoside-triphosphate reductase activating protein [Holdemanella biformis]
MKYLDLTTCSIADGKGFRLVLWCSGCEHHCEACQNEQSWDCNNGYEFTDKTIESIINELSDEYIYGLTLSGGDPMHKNNVLEIFKLCKKVKEQYPNKTIWLYTGYRFEDIWIPKNSVTNANFDLERGLRNDILNHIDVLVDGRYVKELRDIALPFRGSSNQRIIDVQKTLQEQKIVLFES